MKLDRAGKVLVNIISCFLAVLLAGCSFFAPSNPYDPAENAKVRVLLQKTEGLSVLSEYYADVEPGETVAFPVEVMEGYEIGEVENGFYDPASGSITVAGTRYPTTVRVKMIKTGGSGTESSAETAEPSSTPSNTPEVTATELPSEFPETSFTPAPSNTSGPTDTPDPAETPEPQDTATPVPTDTPDPANETPGLPAGTIPIVWKDPVLNEKLYPTFPADPGETPGPSKDPKLSTDFKIVYHANGGTVTVADAPAAYMYFPKKTYLLPNALPDTGYFLREGYILGGYTTEPDGKGDFYAPGWNIITDGEDEINLYCLWKKAEPENMFVCEITDKYAVIKSYKGDSGELVIPERISGKKVLQINSGAFSGKNMSTVYIPKYVETVEWGAFSNCKKLTSAHISDSVISMSDGAFTGCADLKTVYMNAVRNPAYMNALIGTGSIKYERLQLVKGKKVIIISGSGSLYGIDSQIMEQQLPGYSVVNMGIIVNVGAVFYAEVAASYTEV
ncbi:MAG: leucine-rich repeat protein, partial [Clostridia bacterium]|nr:leucine-rich repeat protein [Clostridia bacterium]